MAHDTGAQGLGVSVLGCYGVLHVSNPEAVLILIAMHVDVNEQNPNTLAHANQWDKGSIEEPKIMYPPNHQYTFVLGVSWFSLMSVTSSRQLSSTPPPSHLFKICPERNTCF